MACIITLLVSLFVVLSSNEDISPSLKGLALTYTVQVHLNKQVNEHFSHFIIRNTLQTAKCVCFPADQHASVRSKTGDRGGGKIQLSGAHAGIHQGEENVLLYTGRLAKTTKSPI